VRTAPITEQAQVLQIALGTASTWSDASYHYLFRATGSSDIYDEAIFEKLRAKDLKRIAIYYDSSEYAQAGAKKLSEYVLHDPDMLVVWSHSYDSLQTDFEADFEEMILTSPDAVILYTASENAGRQLKQLRESVSFRGTVYAPEVFAASTTRQEAGESLTGLIFACTSMIPESPSFAFSDKEQAFLESFIKMYGTMPVADTAYRGYDAMMILAEAFRNTKSMESEDLRQAMLDLVEYEGISGIFDFSDGLGDGLHSCRIVTVRDPDHIETEEYHKPY
jgi:branched-chain amino acid transport system substrate-binding protein